jgi:Holliday junction resolvase RusA-like endonuclease
VSTPLVLAKEFVVKIPGHPDAILAPNRRAHGHAKAEATKQHRTDAKYAAVDARNALEVFHVPMFPGPVVVTVLVRWGKEGRRHDLDSTAVMTKPHVDGIVDAGILTNDSQMAELRVKQERDKTGVGEVVITIREQEATA